MSEVVLLGVRHHGPGSARAVRRALRAYRPEVVLIEGPPEADALVALVGSAEMAPPVALLAYAAEPRAAASKARRPATFWPFAEFSPEWQAMRWAVAAGVPVRLCDLPAAHRFAPTAKDTEESTVDTADDVDEEPAAREPVDPIGLLAAAAGYTDAERWWEDVVEHQVPADAEDELAAALAPFEAVAAAMSAVRAELPEPSGTEGRHEQRREAYMRTVLRTALKQYARVAVVCGAWHVPALTAPLPTATADATVLRGLAKGRTALTWVPWTHGRLASWQGYGAGVTSPGWYHHLFTEPDRPVTRWLVAVAALLRAEGLPISSAHVIEAVRLAESLAALRGRPLPGLPEVTEATRAVLCDGEELRVDLVNRRMVVGERLGTVPAETPAVPLVADVTATQKRLRLKPSGLETSLDLDMRRDIDLERSRLLHRLRLLGVAWGEPSPERRGMGTFWESWQLRWDPQFAVDLIDAGAYGTTVAAAATAKATELAGRDGSLADLTRLVQACLLADLAGAWPVVLRAVADRVALDADVTHLMTALPALIRTLRYGDVRGTDVAAVAGVVDGLVRRICVGLPAAVTALDDTAATAMRGHLDEVHTALALLADPARRADWQATLRRLADRDDLHGLIAGRLTRLLFDSDQLDPDEVGRRMGMVLTAGVPPARAAAWIEGFLTGGGLLLVHDSRLLALVDHWLASIAAETFVEVLPLLRRTFEAFAGPERRAIGERARYLGGGAPPRPDSDRSDVDPVRGALVRPTLVRLLGHDVLEVAG